jgi:hypothetical protein
MLQQGFSKTLQHGERVMRQEQQPLAAAQNAANFKISFQMTNAGARHACTVTIRALSETDATTMFRENWLVIEKLARQRLAGHEVGPEPLLPAPIRLSRPVQPDRKRRPLRAVGHEVADLRKANNSTTPAAAINPAVQ